MLGFVGRGVAVGAALLATALALAACSSVPADRYGVDSVEIEGMDELDDRALEVCLATRERPRVGFQLGLSLPPSCGSPPFDANAIRIGLWRWPWTEWPLYDEFVFERDRERVLRWFQARGYYDAQLVDWTIEPEAARQSDTVEPDTDCDRLGDDEGCEVQIVLVVEEGEPTLVSRVDLAGHEDLPDELREALEEAVPLQVGQRFDEAVYERSKQVLRQRLLDASYARAQIKGRVYIHADRREAEVELYIGHGPSSVFGEVTVVASEDLPREAIRGAAAIEAGDAYSPARVREAQAAVYDMGGFSAVNVQPRIPDQGNVVDVSVEVTPVRRSRFQVGAGIQSGVVQQGSGEQRDEVPQWDVHLLGSWEHRNLFGGLRRLRIEERPRLIFTDSFPATGDPTLGNIVSLRFAQPAFIEPRTTLHFDSKWELGPDPFLDIFRHEVDLGPGLERYFFERRLFATAGIRERFYVVTDSGGGGNVPSDYDLLFLEQLLRLDLRDDPLRTRLGMHLSVSLQEAGYFLPSSWSYIRVVPDFHGYLPLPLGITLATRFSVGALLIHDAESNLDALSQELGPTTERLRGGGGTSNRGFFPGQLGDGPDGGVRRWLATLELRLPLTRSFFLTPFLDAGDVSRETRFRFDHPQISTGLGFRILTPIGPVRLDFGWRVPGWQVLAEEDQRNPGGRLTEIDLLLTTFPGAVNLTLGDAF